MYSYNCKLDGWPREATSADGLFAVDSQQRILLWGESAQALFGYRAEEVLGRRCYEVIAGQERQNLRFCRRNCPVIRNARRGRPTANYDILASTRDGRQLWVNASILLLEGPRKARFVLHLMRDVTPRRQLEEAARSAARALRQFIPQGYPPAEEPAGALASPPVPQLTRRELEVLRLLACGLDTRQIAESLVVSPVTVRNHIASLLTKLGARSRLHAVLYASQRGLV